MPSQAIQTVVEEDSTMDSDDVNMHRADSELKIQVGLQEEAPGKPNFM
jgi:hypothetical protein